MTKAQKKAQRKATRASARARKAKGGSKRKGVRRAGRKAGKGTVARRNLRKARSARARNKRAGGPRHKVKGYRYKRPAKTVSVKSHMSYEDKPKRRKRRSSKRRRHAAEASESPKKRSRRSSRRRTGGRRRKLSMKKSAVAARRRRRAAGEPRKAKRRSSKRRTTRRRHKVKGHTARRGSRRYRVKAHMSREGSRRKRRSSRRRRHGRRRSSGRRRTSMSRRRGYALENPLSAKEIFWGAITGTLGFLAADALDRVWATHALGPASGGALGTDGKPLFGDTPPAAGTGIFKTNYVGLYTATAILAPMDWKRWLSGVVITAAPFGLAMLVKNPVGRSSMQFFGFGAGVRILGKAVDDLMAKLFGRTSWGARLYDGEARAAAMRALAAGGTDTTGNFPTAGLGAMPDTTGVGGCSCANCSAGVGACCRKSNSQVLPPPVGVDPVQGQASNPVVPVGTPDAPMPTPAPALPASPVVSFPLPSQAVVPGVYSGPTPGMLAGLPRRPQAKANGARKSPYAWSGTEDKAAE